jgi:hypothetical protein
MKSILSVSSCGLVDEIFIFPLFLLEETKRHSSRHGDGTTRRGVNSRNDRSAGPDPRFEIVLRLEVPFISQIVKSSRLKEFAGGNRRLH